MNRSSAARTACVAGLAMWTVWAAGVSAQSYPGKPVRIVVGYAPGGGTDITSRIVAQKLADLLGQSVLVENRTGAAATIAAERVATSAPDGYTLLMMAAADSAQPALRKLNYDLQRDLAPITRVVRGPAFVLVVHPALPAKNALGLAQLAKSKPGQVSFASSGVGSQAHLAGALLGFMMKVELGHVPFKLISDATVSVVNGDILMGFPSVPAALPLLGNGKLRAVAVTSVRRVGVLAAVPTLDESGLKGYDREGWYGLLAPGKLPAAIVGQLNTAVGKVLDSPETQRAFEKQGLESAHTTPADFAALIRTEVTQSAQLIKLAGVKPE